jgi:hypothetical protein
MSALQRVARFVLLIIAAASFACFLTLLLGD